MEMQSLMAELHLYESDPKDAFALLTVNKFFLNPAAYFMTYNWFNLADFIYFKLALFITTIYITVKKLK